MVKVKVLKSALEGNKAKEIALRIAEQTKTSLVEVRGHTFMLYKRRKSESLYMRLHDLLKEK
jgi:RNA-binding protein YhbY